MTTAQIVTFADPGQLANPDLNLDVELRRNVIPLFYSKADHYDEELGGGVGYARWFRKDGVLQAITQGDTSFVLPADFGEMKYIALGMQVTSSTSLDFQRHELTYIGDRPDKVERALSATQQVRPSGYFFGGTPGAMTLMLSDPSDAAYTCRYSYWNQAVFPDDTTSVDLNAFIPPQFQWTLVELLRRVLYGFRFGIGDERYGLATANAKRGLQAARANLEQSNYGKKPKFVA